MKVVGLTGGIGSGKSTVAKMFNELGVAVYIADDRAKYLMNNDVGLKKEIKSLLGEASYLDGKLNRKYIASIIFNDKQKLDQISALVHPAVTIDFDLWKNRQKGEYVVKEVAILFENGGHLRCDFTVLITAPVEIRIERVLSRDESTRAAILSRMANQWEDARKIPLANFVVFNEKLTETKENVCKIHIKILKLLKNN